MYEGKVINMGCDIHLYFERKNKDKWEKINIPEELLPNDRYYKLFSFIADVRNHEEDKIMPQFPDRGIPDDSSMPLDEDECWMGDHSFTHAYLDEILNAPWKQNELNDCYFYIFCVYVLPRFCSWCGTLSFEEKKNIRVIMGFDN